jgi:hypothetical protein
MSSIASLPAFYFCVRQQIDKSKKFMLPVLTHSDEESEGPVEALTRNFPFQLDLLRNRLALRTFVCASLARQLENANYVEKPAITLRWEETLKECHVLQLVVDLLERQKRKQSAREAEVCMPQSEI